MYGLRRNSSVYVYFFCVHESRTTVADAGSDLEYVWLLICDLGAPFRQGFVNLTAP
jgi:hypothetical protein